MNYLNVHQARNKFCEVIRSVEEGEDIVITKQGKPVAVIEHITDDNIVDFMLSKSPKFRAMIEKRFADSKKQPGENIENVIEQLKSRAKKVSGKNK